MRLIILAICLACMLTACVDNPAGPVLDEPVSWTTTPDELRLIADRMETGQSLTGSGIFAKVADDQVEIYLEGF